MDAALYADVGVDAARNAAVSAGAAFYTDVGVGAALYNAA